MNAKEKILSKLRASKLPPLAPPSWKAETVFTSAFCNLSQSELLSAFADRLASLKGELFRASSRADAGRILLELLKKETPPFVFVDSELLRAICLSCHELSSLYSSRLALDDNNNNFSSASVGISSSSYFLASSGSILLVSSKAGGRRLSVLPPVHIAVCEVTQVINSLGNWLREISEDSSWSSASIITGPSRTADIEKILVLGAHGPKRLIALLID